MKIKGMVQREDFYRINESTLKKYYKAVYGKDVAIKTKAYSFLNRILIYPNIGTEMTRFPGRKVLKYLLSEYNVRNSLAKYIIAKTYVFACFFSFGLLGGKGLEISDRQLFDNNTAVIPANRKIRIYNFTSGTVDAVVKDTFTTKYFDNELAFRLNNKYDFILPIKEHGDDWYREGILQGQALARISDPGIYEKGEKDALASIGIIAAATLEYTDAAVYAKELLAGITEKIRTAAIQKHITCGDAVMDTAQAACAQAVLLNTPLPTVLSHGDLQAGNIWVDKEKGKTYLLDWETVERRSIWYDCATLLLSTRRANKLKEMMENCETAAVKAAVLANDNRRDYPMHAVMGIITLEDILFYLDDMLELPQDFGCDIFTRIAGELDAMGWRKI